MAILILSSIIFFLIVIIIGFVYYFFILPKVCPENSSRDEKGVATNIYGCYCKSGYYWLDGSCNS
jgi:hypothetical protein